MGPSAGVGAGVRGAVLCRYVVAEGAQRVQRLQRRPHAATERQTAFATKRSAGLSQGSGNAHAAQLRRRGVLFVARSNPKLQESTETDARPGELVEVELRVQDPTVCIDGFCAVDDLFDEPLQNQEEGAPPAAAAAAAAASPNRWTIAATMSAAFVLCNMDKVNMSVAVIPMAKEFGWSASDKGLVSSAFFWGYTLTQIPGGLLSKRLGGAVVLALGVGVWSLGTLLTPLAAYLPAGAFLGVCAARFLVGLGEGAAPPASAGLMVQHMPASERARAVTLVFGGGEVGNVLGLLAAPPLIAAYGWQAVFYLFGWAGFVWIAGWPLALSSAKNAEGASLGERLGNAKAEAMRMLQPPKSDVAENNDVPWGEFARCPAVWAVVVTHFCNNWGYYTLLAWLPSYFEGGLGQDLSAATYLSLLPYLSMASMNVAVGPVADKLATSMNITTVRKLAQGTAFLGPAACNVALAMLSPEDPANLTHPVGMYVALLSVAFGLSAWSRAGLYCNHQDLSPKYVSVLLGLSNTAGAVPGVLGVWVAGYLLDATGGDWGAAVFWPAAVFQLIGAATFLTLGSGERQEFDAA